MSENLEKPVALEGVQMVENMNNIESFPYSREDERR